LPPSPTLCLGRFEWRQALPLLDQGRSDVWPATRADMAAVFDGFTLIEPGIVPAGEWRPAAGTEIPDPKSVGLYAGVARKD